MSTPDDTTTTPLSDLCAICHTTPPKYRCPRCHTRTCSLPCSRRHKLWSQCSGTRDPGAYLRRSELASESAFDRDFNFISGVERSVERAERDAENRGIGVDRRESEDAAMRKRKRGKAPGSGPGPGPGLDVGDGAGGGRGLAKGEAAFLRGAADAGVTVVRAPKGMSREKGNSSRWFPKQKCLNWSVEWILPDRNKVTRDYVESTTLADAYDWVSPPPKEESVGFVHVQLRGQPPGPEMTTQVAGENMQEDPTAAGHSTAGPETQPEQHTHAPADSAEITPHRDLYFYLHRPRTATKLPVLIPLSPNVTFTTALRGRTVLELPTIYVLPDSPGTVLTEKGHLFLLEEEYLRTERPAEDAEVPDTNAAEGVGDSLDANSVDLAQVDEQKVLDVLKQDLFGGSTTS